MIDPRKTLGRQAHRKGLPGVCIFAVLSALWASSDSQKRSFSGLLGSLRLPFNKKRHLKRTQENSIFQREPTVQPQD